MMLLLILSLNGLKNRPGNLGIGNTFIRDFSEIHIGYLVSLSSLMLKGRERDGVLAERASVFPTTDSRGALYAVIGSETELWPPKDF